MMMRHIKMLVAAVFWAINMTAQNTDYLAEVLLETDMGNIRIGLYKETPKHSENFLKLVRDGFYDGVLFHRVIPRFMVQTGDSLSRHATVGQLLGDGSKYETYKIPAEIVYPRFFHQRGAVAAAREPDEVNPGHESSMCQFYIVTGRRYTNNMLDDVEERISRDMHRPFSMPAEIRDVYKQKGGAAHLDTQYTVFGEVVDGMEVVADIEKEQADENNRPLIDLHIIRAIVVGD